MQDCQIIREAIVDILSNRDHRGISITPLRMGKRFFDSSEDFVFNEFLPKLNIDVTLFETLDY